MDGRTDGRTNGRTDGWMDGWMNGWMDCSTCFFDYTLGWLQINKAHIRKNKTQLPVPFFFSRNCWHVSLFCRYESWLHTFTSSWHLFPLTLAIYLHRFLNFKVLCLHFFRLNIRCVFKRSFARKRRKVENRERKQKDCKVAKLLKTWLKPSIYFNYQ